MGSQIGQSVIQLSYNNNKFFFYKKAHSKAHPSIHLFNGHKSRFYFPSTFWSDYLQLRTLPVCSQVKGPVCDKSYEREILQLRTPQARFPSVLCSRLYRRRRKQQHINLGLCGCSRCRLTRLFVGMPWGAVAVAAAVPPLPRWDAQATSAYPVVAVGRQLAMILLLLASWGPTIVTVVY